MYFSPPRPRKDGEERRARVAGGSVGQGRVGARGAAVGLCVGSLRQQHRVSSWILREVAADPLAGPQSETDQTGRHQLGIDGEGSTDKGKKQTGAG